MEEGGEEGRKEKWGRRKSNNPITSGGQQILPEQVLLCKAGGHGNPLTSSALEDCVKNSLGRHWYPLNSSEMKCFWTK